MFLGFFVVEFCKSFCRSCSHADRDSHFLCNATLEVKADFLVILYGTVAVIKKEERFINRIFFNIRSVFHVDGSNPPADISIESVVT